MARVTLDLSTRQLSALRDNLARRSERVRQRVQQITAETGEDLYLAVLEAAPEDTGRTKRLLRLRFSQSRYVYEVGWRDEDFAKEGQPNYMLFYIFGTRKQPPRDFFFPLRDRFDAEYRRRLETLFRRSAAGRRR